MKGNEQMEKKNPNEQNVQITVQILSVPLVQFFFVLCKFT